MKMAILTLVVTLAMLKLSGTEVHEDNIRTMTLDDYVLDQFQLNLRDFLNKNISHVMDPPDFPSYIENNKMVKEILLHLQLLKKHTLLRFLKDFGDVTTESIYNDLNLYCSEDLKSPIKALRDELTKSRCVENRLVELLYTTLKKAADVTAEMCPALCSQENLTICSTEGCSCILGHGHRFGQVMKRYARVDNYVEKIRHSATLLKIIVHLLRKYVFNYTEYLDKSHKKSWIRIAKIMSIAPSLELFGYENLLNQTVYNIHLTNANSNEESTWGVVGSNKGTLKHPCHKYQKVNLKNSTNHDYCDPLRVMESVDNLLSCVYMNSTIAPLAWSTVTSVYVHSQCLCVVYHGKDCGVKAPLGVGDRTYCLSVLLRDFQRQVSFRPAATYLDYAFMSPISGCKLTDLLQVASQFDCFSYIIDKLQKTELSQNLICYFKDLLNKKINCTERLILDTYNVDSLCYTIFFTQLVLCKDGADYNNPVSYYRFGDSKLVLIFHYVDVGLRLLTLVTYLACRQLRNLPGKLLIGYQMVALTRLLAVRSILLYLQDLELAVRLDVTMDLASTLWLAAYLHFVTHCITTLTPPDSLGVSEARVVLLSSSLFGSALPVALSAAFFTMDEVLEVNVQVGQLLFVGCIYAVLLANIIMLCVSFKVYFEIRSDALQVQRNLTARQVFADLFNFVLKTSVLSGAGVLFRLVFTQIPGLVDVLSYYHALGTFHGLLLFLLHGCNREARLFWLSVWRAMRSRCHLGGNTSLRRNSLELQQRPV